MNANVGGIDKILRVIVGIVLIGLAALGIVGAWGWIGVVPLLTGLNPSLALLGAGLTGFYMTRLMLMTFISDKRWLDGVHPHESPKVMTIPLMVLGALSVLGGLLYLNGWKLRGKPMANPWWVNLGLLVTLLFFAWQGVREFLGGST